jgi:hypothetical protein
LCDSPAQKFRPDDPIRKDIDNLPIQEPVPVQFSPTYDLVENSVGSEAGSPTRAENVNTLGEVPDSSWFTNRLGQREISIEELLSGGDSTGAPNSEEPLTIIEGVLAAFIEGLIVRDSRGFHYFLSFDRVGFPRLATGAGFIGSKFFRAFGYNVPTTYLIDLDPGRLVVDPSAEVRMLGGKRRPIDRQFLEFMLGECHRDAKGTFRVLTHKLPTSEYVGGFKFFGTKSDDPNDIFPHENRRELRGLRVFAAWLNHTECNSTRTGDFFIPDGEKGFLKHYLIDFGTALGSGQDLNHKITPKDPRSGNEYTMWGDSKSGVKTALSLGLWQRPWLKIRYPYPELAEIGRIEADHFSASSWKPSYPNPAFDRMMADDALWATAILAKLSDEMIRAVVAGADYSNPDAEEYLGKILIQRRNEIIDHYFRQMPPLGDFEVNGDLLKFRNLGPGQGLAGRTSYQYQWFRFENEAGQLTELRHRTATGLAQIPIPYETHEFLMVRIRPKTETFEGWKKNIEVYLRRGTPRSIVGIDRGLEAN